MLRLIKQVKGRSVSYHSYTPTPPAPLKGQDMVPQLLQWIKQHKERRISDHARQQYLTPEIEELIELGKKKLLWAIEVVYTVDGTTKRYRKRNLRMQEIMATRKELFEYGLAHPVEPGHYKIINPLDYQEMDVFKQDRYIPD